MFATPFVGWEVRRLPEVSTLFPFTNTDGSFAENQSIRVIKREPWHRQFRFNASCERLDPNPKTLVLMWAEHNLPVIGCTAVGPGIIYYLNFCQHACAGSMQSPLRTSEDLKVAVRETFTQIGLIRSYLEFEYKDRTPTLMGLTKNLFSSEDQKTYYSSPDAHKAILRRSRKNKRHIKKR